MSNDSKGNTLPLTGLPWGFNHWAPQTKSDSMDVGSWWFQGSDHEFHWLRCTHQPSPWIDDWGWFLITPQVGDQPHRSPVFFWEPRGATIKPYMFDATLSPFNMRIQLVPTNHGAILRTTFPKEIYEGDKKRVCATRSHFTRPSDSAGHPTVTGVSTQAHHDRMLLAKFNMHIRIESKDAVSVYPADDMMCFEFKHDAEIVDVHMATSLISEDQARVNFEQEVSFSKTTFETTAAQAKFIWHT